MSETELKETENEKTETVESEACIKVEVWNIVCGLKEVTYFVCVCGVYVTCLKNKTAGEYKLCCFVTFLLF